MSELVVSVDVLVVDCLEESPVFSVPLSILLSDVLLSVEFDDVVLLSVVELFLSDPSVWFPLPLVLESPVSLLSLLSVFSVVSTVSLELFFSFLAGSALVEEFFLDRLRLLPDELSLVELVSVVLEDESSFLVLSSLESSFLESVGSSRSKDGVGGGL